MNDEGWTAREARQRTVLSRRQLVIGGAFGAAAVAGDGAAAHGKPARRG